MLVLNTRLNKPPVDKGYIQRKRLITILQNNQDKILKLVIAGAGYGKSVLISQWLEICNEKFCWISVHEDFNDIRVALSYLVTAVQSVFSDTLKKSNEAVNTIQTVSVKSLGQILINELAEINEPLNIVFDDFHLNNNLSLNEIIDDFLTNPPQNVKITLISRYDPAIKLNTLRTYDRICELRSAELAFTQNEIHDLAARLHNLEISEEISHSIYSLTEGWTIGIRLILKKIAGGESIEESLNSIHGTSSHFSQYLLEEILNKQLPHVREVLLASSLFDRFNLDFIHFLRPVLNIDADITNEVLTNDIQRFVDSSMFIIPLDYDSKWYRFHHLIQSFLQNQIKHQKTQEQLHVIYHRACLHMESKGFLSEAIDYALKSMNAERAASIINNHKHELLNSDKFHLLDRWLQLLPSGTIENHAGLLMARAMIHDTTANYPAMIDDLESAALILQPFDMKMENSRADWGEYYAIHSAVSYYLGRLETSIQSSQKALELLNDSKGNYIRDFALAFHVFSNNALNGGNRAEAILENELKIFPQKERHSLMRNQIVKVLLFLINGKFSELPKPAKLAYDISKEEKMWLSNTMAAYGIAVNSYISGQLTDVDRYNNIVDNHKYASRPFWALNMFSMNAMAMISLNKHAEVENYISEMHSFAQQFQNKPFDKFVTVFEIEVALRMRNIKHAVTLASTAEFDIYPPVYYYYFPQLTKVKLMMAQGGKRKQQEAKNLLEDYLKLSQKSNNILFRIQVLLLYALLFKKSGDLNASLDKIREVLTLGKQECFIRTFLDLDEDMYSLLEQLEPDEKNNACVSKILTAFRNERKSGNNSNLNTGKGELNELTRKEIEILQLIGSGFQNKKIAEKLFISETTVKTHVYRIYKKLEVPNRLTALIKAKEHYPHFFQS